MKKPFGKHTKNEDRVKKIEIDSKALEREIELKEKEARKSRITSDIDLLETEENILNSKISNYNKIWWANLSCHMTCVGYVGYHVYQKFFSEMFEPNNYLFAAASIGNIGFMSTSLYLTRKVKNARKKLENVEGLKQGYKNELHKLENDSYSDNLIDDINRAGNNLKYFKRGNGGTN